MPAMAPQSDGPLRHLGVHRNNAAFNRSYLGALASLPTPEFRLHDVSGGVALVGGNPRSPVTVVISPGYSGDARLLEILLERIGYFGAHMIAFNLPTTNGTPRARLTAAEITKQRAAAIRDHVPDNNMLLFMGSSTGAALNLFLAYEFRARCQLVVHASGIGFPTDFVSGARTYLRSAGGPQTTAARKIAETRRFLRYVATGPADALKLGRFALSLDSRQAAFLVAAACLPVFPIGAENDLISPQSITARTYLMTQACLGAMIAETGHAFANLDSKRAVDLLDFVLRVSAAEAHRNSERGWPPPDVRRAEWAMYQPLVDAIAGQRFQSWLSGFSENRMHRWSSPALEHALA